MCGKLINLSLSFINVSKLLNPQHTVSPGQVPTFAFFLLHLLDQMPICVKVASLTHNGNITATVVRHVCIVAN
jgi:hypothetical protein